MISITVGKSNPKRRGELIRLDRGVGGWKGGQGETRGVLGRAWGRRAGIRGG